jgi:hypothetical protein
MNPDFAGQRAFAIGNGMGQKAVNQSMRELTTGLRDHRTT